MTRARYWGVIAAAGSGSRMAALRPKQYLEIAGATVLEHSLRALLACEQIQRVVVVLQPGDATAAGLVSLSQPRVLRVAGGAQRSDSVLAGLNALLEIGAEDDWVLVHDAARPCVEPEDIRRLIREVAASGIGALLAEPVVDTLKNVDDLGRVQATLERAGLWRAQTPQMFRLGELHEALRQLCAQGLALTDEAAAMEWAGHPVQVIAAASANPKITRPGDLDLAAYYLTRTGG